MPLEMKINRYKENINIVVMDLNNTDMFLEYDWLVKYNPEVKWTNEQYGLQDAQRNAKYSTKIFCSYLEPKGLHQWKK